MDSGRCPNSTPASMTTTFRDTGVLKATTTEAAKVPGDQPDYIEDDPETADVDESEDANEHVFTIIVSDGTSEAEHEFTLMVTDVDDPAPGSNQKLRVNEGVEGTGRSGRIRRSARRLS